MKRRVASIVVSVAVLAGLSLATAGADVRDTHHRGGGHLRPIVFVHGFSGSGAQFETQALRFTSNGYPARHIAVHEYDSLFSVETRTQVFERLDDLISALLERTGMGEIDLLGHSLGTGLMQSYLNSSPERAAKVAHYVNLDGATATAPPGGVPTLAVWGMGSTARKIAGAANIYLTSQTHTQVVTSEETFEEVYTFFTGEEPETTDIVAARSPLLLLSGRAVLFPQNTGADGATLKIYEVNGATGARVRNRADASFRLGADGSWGPFAARPRRNYEFAIVREGAATHHLYFEPFVRDDRWIRLLTSPPSGGIGDLQEVGDRHAALSILRYKEWWGDQGASGDVLEVNGVNILNAANTPVSKRAIGIFVFDAGSDAVTDLTAPLPAFAALPFITGVDVFVPAADPPRETISIASTPRGGGGHVELINLPNWSSTNHRISVQFNDYLHD